MKKNKEAAAEETKISYKKALRSRTFRTGGSTAVRLPKDFGFEDTDVMVSKVAEGILIRPAPPVRDVATWWADWDAMPDFMAEGRAQPAMQARDFGNA